jgi:hypothetical protein
MKLKNVLPCLLLLVPAIALAQWTTTVEDDIFTGGKKATMIAIVGDYDSNIAIVFDCTKKDIELAYVEKSSDQVGRKIAVDMVMKIDSGEIIKANAVFERRNDLFVQVGMNDRDTIIQILKEASKAKSKMIVGLSNDAIGQHSVTAAMNGSSKAVNQFASACEIDIK